MSYVFIVKLSLNTKPLIGNSLSEVFPMANEAALTSNEFEEYRACVAACKDLMNNTTIEMTKIYNSGNFDIVWETNPFMDGRIEKMPEEEKKFHKHNWASGEMLKMFAVNANLKDEKTSKLFAAASASVLSLKKMKETLEDISTN